MKKFSDLGIKPVAKAFTGTKVEIYSILNRKIIVSDFRIVDTKYPGKKGNGKCLHLQIKIGEMDHVVFTGSVGLMDLIQQVDKSSFPFETTITKVDGARLQFN